MANIEFKGKQFVYSHHHTVPFKNLEINKSKSTAKSNSKNFSNENLLLYGDNLHALKSLSPIYSEKIKCIYIDPPYNTGNEGWSYNDNVNSPLMKAWLEKNTPVDREDLERHDKWLCMMYPRLKLLKNLLSSDGTICVSINDLEVHRLRMMMDDIFSEKNFITEITVKSNPRGSNSSQNLADVHEYLLIYAKDIENCKINELPLNIKTIEDYNDEDKDGKPIRWLGLRQRGGEWRKEDREKMHYPFYVNPKNSKVSLIKSKDFNIEVIPIRPTTNELGRWTWSKELANKKINLLRGKKIINKTNNSETWNIERMDHLYNNDNQQKTTLPKTIWDEKNYNYQNGRKVIKEIFDGKDLFDYPKPVDLIKKIIKICSDKDSIILDSFAGSGTTAHAVLDLNNDDGGNRKFICIQMKEELNGRVKEEAKKFNYKEVIDITYNRIKRINEGIKNSSIDILKKGYQKKFIFCDLGKEINLENILSSKNIPTYDDFAKYIFFNTTGESLEKINNKDYYVGESSFCEIYLIYKQDKDYLLSNESALDEKKLNQILKKSKSKKEKIIFASSKFLSQKELFKFGVTFCQIPFDIYRINKK